MEVLIAIEMNVQRLRDLGHDKADQTVTEKEYSLAAQNTELITSLTGKNKVHSWPEFKQAFIDYQRDFGFDWVPSPGRGGPLRLQSVALPRKVGESLADRQYRAGEREGEFDKLVKQELEGLHSYLHASEVPIDICVARGGFGDFCRDNKSYKFLRGRGSMKFALSIQKYRYHDSDRSKSESALGKGILDDGGLKDILNLDHLEHTQESRHGGMFENADFVGFRIQRHVEGDKFLMYAFELKATNAISAVSDAISQAVNYRSRANFTYIVIPLFDQSSFHDSERLDDFIEMCRINHIGIISVDLKPDTHELKDFIIILSAPEAKLEDSTLLAGLIANSKWEMCPLCRKIVNSEKDRANCGWLISRADKAECMKEVMENRMLPQ